MERWKFTITAAVLVLLLFLFVRPDKADVDRDREATPEKRQPPISALDSQFQAENHRHRREEAPGSDSIVTGTWGALREQDPIQLPDGGTARIGIETSSAPVSSGVLIYCLVEDSDQSGSRSVVGTPFRPVQP